MVERVVHIDDVRGSNPLSPTITAKSAPDVARFCHVGLGVFHTKAACIPAPQSLDAADDLKEPFKGC